MSLAVLSAVVAGAVEVVSKVLLTGNGWSSLLLEMVGGGLSALTVEGWASVDDGVFASAFTLGLKTGLILRCILKW